MKNKECECTELKWYEEGDVWPYEVWKCVDCNTLFNVTVKLVNETLLTVPTKVVSPVHRKSTITPLPINAC